MTPTQIGAAVIGAVATLLTAVVAVAKLRPDRTRAIVESAATTLAMSDSLRDDLVSSVRDQGATIARQAQDLDAIRAQLDARVAADRARDDRIRDLEETIRSERRTHAREVDALTARVEVLEAALVANDLPIPPSPGPTGPVEDARDHR